MGCLWSKRCSQQHEDIGLLAKQTLFSVRELEALHELFRKLSSSVVDDGVISKISFTHLSEANRTARLFGNYNFQEEFRLGLFKDKKKQNLFADRIFDVFDVERQGVIGFREFVRSLSIFHPDSSEAEKVEFAFHLYDIRETGFIEREEVVAMLTALLDESKIILPDDIVNAIIDKTFAEADTKCDGKIDRDEWREFVACNPTLLRNMTIPYLKDLPTSFPSFKHKSEVKD